MCLTKAGMMAADGRCKAFDARANGYVRSEGAGLVVLKPLSRALADGDPIYAVIRGTASNQDGRSSGIAAPNGDAQQAVTLAACRHAGVSPGELDYVEAYGTGTPVGDPIEVKALGEVLRIDRAPDDPCAIGSVKTNIGHAESAAGVASLIKAALVLRHREIPPSLHFEQPNPLIPWNDLPLRVQRQLGPLPERSRPALAGVNGFGIGGTNVHVILEEAPRPAAAPSVAPRPPRPFLLPLSARSPLSLRGAAEAMVQRLREPDAEADLPNLCYTAAQRRAHHERRLVVTGSTAAEMADSLAGYLQQGLHPAVTVGHASPLAGRPKLAFVFSGQGSQWWGMGRRLLEREPVFKRVIEECDGLLRPHTGWSLREELGKDEAQSRLDQTQYAQPALFAIQVALATWWQSVGVVPEAVVGHSVGEVAAAHLAGVLALPDAARLIAHRGRLMQQATGKGRMASVELPAGEVEPLLARWRDRLSIAAINGPSSVVLSGEVTALRIVVQELEAGQVTCVMMPMDYAFHSPQMEPYRDELVTLLADLQVAPANGIPMFSTVTGSWCQNQVLDARYWGANIRQQVLLALAIEALARDGFQLFLEVGPHAVISGTLSRNLKALGSRAVVLPPLRREEDEQKTLLTAFGALHAHGREGDWKAVQAGGRVSQSLPRYCWDRQRFWLDAPDKNKQRRRAEHPLLGARLPVAHPVWQNRLDLQAHAFLRDYRVHGRSLLPASVLAEVALGAALEQGEPGGIALKDLSFEGAAELADGESGPMLQVTLSPEPGGEVLVRVFSQPPDAAAEPDAWRLHLTARTSPRAHNGVVHKGANGAGSNGAHGNGNGSNGSNGNALAGARNGVGALAHTQPAPLALEELRALCAEELDVAELYSALEQTGIQYGPALRAVEAVWKGDGVALVCLTLLEAAAGTTAGFRIHPAVLEGATQACRVVYGRAGGRLSLARLQRVRTFEPLPLRCLAFARLRPVPELSEELPACDLWICDEAGQVLATLEGVCFRYREDQTRLSAPSNPAEWLYDIAWEPAGSPLAATEPPPPGGSWLIFADEAGVGEALAGQLAARGERAVLVQHGSDYARIGPDRFAVALSRPEDLARLLAEALTSREIPFRGVVHLWSTDADRANPPTAASLAADQSLIGINILHVIQALTAAAFTRPPRLFLVTRGSQPIGPEAPPVTLSQSTVWGLGKVITMEHAELRCCRIDLSPVASPPEEVAALLEECWAHDREDQVALRGANRFLARLVRHPLESASGAALSLASEAGTLTTPGEQPFRIELAEVGHPGSAFVRQIRRRAPRPGEVEIRVLTAELEPGDLARRPVGTDEGSVWLAGACSGRVLRAGAGVDDLGSGDLVVALGAGCLTPHLNVRASAAVVVPDGVEPEQAAVVARPFLLAGHALEDLARLSPGEQILINGAGSLRGLAALTVARRLGATVLATAASESERSWLLERGAAHVFDAQALSVTSEVLKLTGGRGVDVVLNLVAGFPLDDLLPALKSFGRCVDAGSGRVGLPPARGVAFHACDLALLERERPDKVREQLRQLMVQLQSGTLAPLPLRRFPLERTTEALTSLLEPGGPTAVAVRLPEPEGAAPPAPAPAFRSDASYLITGGLGQLGLSLAARMVRRGVRHLVLSGRRAPSAAAVATLERLRQQGARVEVVNLDVADEAEVRALVQRVQREMPPLRGVIHAAGVLENGLLIQLDEARFRAVQHSKIAGSWHLHQHTRELPLDFFVLFSSLASLIGSPGQGNYAGANAFLDGLALYRRAQGLPALSIGWGPWAEIGMAAGLDDSGLLRERGLGLLPPETALDLFERLLEEPGGAIGAIAINWRLWSEFYPSVMEAPFVSHLVTGRQGGGAPEEGRLTVAVLTALAPEARLERLQSVIHGVVCQALQLDAETLGMDVSLSAVGLDSIVALELKNRLESRIEVVVQTPSLLKGPTVQQLADQFVTQVLAGPAAPASEPALAIGRPAAGVDPAEAERLLGRIDKLSDADVSALLAGTAGAADEA